MMVAGVLGGGLGYAVGLALAWRESGTRRVRDREIDSEVARERQDPVFKRDPDCPFGINKSDAGPADSPLSQGPGVALLEQPADSRLLPAAPALGLGLLRCDFRVVGRHGCVLLRGSEVGECLRVLISGDLASRIAQAQDCERSVRAALVAPETPAPPPSLPGVEEEQAGNHQDCDRKAENGPFNRARAPVVHVAVDLSVPSHRPERVLVSIHVSIIAIGRLRECELPLRSG